MSVLGPLAGRSWYLARVVSPHGMGNLASLYRRAGTNSISFDFSRSGGTETWHYNFRSPQHFPFEPFSHWTTFRRGHVHFSSTWTTACAIGKQQRQPPGVDGATVSLGDH